MTIKTNSGLKLFMESAIATAKTISGITKAAPGVVSSTTHGFTNNDIVLLEVQGMVELNGRLFKVVNVAADSFQLAGVDGTTGIALAEAYDADLADRTKRMVALSMRIHAGTDDNIIITGFVLSGDAGKRVIIRGIGPAMADSVSGYLRDPELLLYRYNTQTLTWALVGQNDNWGGSADMAAAFAAVGLGALDSDSRDSALIVDLEPGIYTAHVRSANGETGIGLAEIYEAR